MTGTKWMINLPGHSNNLHSSVHSVHSAHEDEPIIKQNPIFLDELAELDHPGLKLITATITHPKRLLLSWNPEYVYRVDIKGVQISISSLRAIPLHSDTDRSLPSLSSLHLNQLSTYYEPDKQSRSSSEIDEDLFDMSQFPSLPEPKITSHPLSILPDRMIKDLSLRLASSRERTLLTTTLAKSERFTAACSDFSSLPGSSAMPPLQNQQSTVMLPILHELDLMLANSRTLNTLKMKVHRAKEQLQDSSYDVEKSSLFSHTQHDGANVGKPAGRLKRFYNRKRRVCQALIAFLLLVLFLSMLVSLSICCSKHN